MGCFGYHHRAAKTCEIKQQEGAAAADITLAIKRPSQKEVEKMNQGREQQKV